jgi:DNA-binding MarR family transcriptional regulator
MSNVVETDINAEAVSQTFIKLVSHVMKRSSAPMMELVEEFDLTFAHFKLLFVLSAQDEPQPIGRLAEITGQSLPSAGRAIDGLVRSGLATRTEDPSDRRVKRVELSPRGVEGVEAINRSRIENLSDLIGRLDEPELVALASALDPLVAAADETACAADLIPTPKEKEAS